MRKIFVVLLFIPFFISCGEDLNISLDEGTDTVDSGSALTHNSLVKSAQCSEGQLSIYSSSGKTALLGGENVSIKGNITIADSCFKQPIQFSCEASVTVGVNRVFTCNGGQVSVAYGSVFNQNSVPTSPLDIFQSHQPVSTTPYHSGTGTTQTTSSLIYGLINIYNNGTSTAVFLTYYNPNATGFVCSHQFICSDL